MAPWTRFTAVLVELLAGGFAARAVRAQDLAWSLPHGTHVVPHPELVDFDGDGSLELVFNDRNTGRFFVVDTTTGAIRFQASGWAWAIDLFDFDRDGFVDVLTGPALNRFDVYSGRDFSVLHTFTVAGVQASEPFLVPDVTGDGLADLAVVADLAGVAAFASDDDHELWKVACGYVAPVALDDLDGDEAIEVLAKSPACNAKVAAISSRDGSLVLEYDESRQGLPYPDDDGDGFGDLFFHADARFRIRSGKTGVVIRDVPEVGDLHSVVPLADVDGDGFRELLGADSTQPVGVIVSGHDLQTVLYEWTAAVAPGSIVPLFGDADFDHDGFEDFLFSYLLGTSAETQIRRGNDLWLRARETVVSSGVRDATLGLALGAASGIGVLVVVEVNGIPTWVNVHLELFGADQAIELSARVPPSLFGTHVRLYGLGIGRSGRVEDTAVLPFEL